MADDAASTAAAAATRTWERRSGMGVGGFHVATRRSSAGTRGSPWIRVTYDGDGRRRRATSTMSAADGVVVRGARGDGSGGGGLRTLTVCGGRSEDLLASAIF